MNNLLQAEMASIKSADDARQGVTGHGVRYVLFFSFSGALILLAVTGFVFFGS
jgi:hypothetical protein